MVHHTMKIKMSKANKASNRNSHMVRAIVGALALTLGGCAFFAPSSQPEQEEPTPMAEQPVPKTAPASAAVPVRVFPEVLGNNTAPPAMPKSQWVPTSFADLPGWGQDSEALHAAWNAWIKSCQRPAAVWVKLCASVRQLSIASATDKAQWMQAQLQPYRVQSSSGDPVGLLTAYYEPVLMAKRQADAQFRYPLYAVPRNLGQRKPWFSRQEMDTLAQAQEDLRGKEIAFLNDPVEVLKLHIQGSGVLQLQEPGGGQSTVRVAYAATNDQPYRSVGRWLIDQGLTRDATWPGISRWIAQNPSRVQELLWSNPRVVFFREEQLTEQNLSEGPKGAQGVPLTPEHSIAVDPQSLPYGAPVWLVTQGTTLNTQGLVLAQDTGSAIVGAVRADYFMGRGDAAGERAGRLKQPLQMWVLWPR
jgi:membrane-bound lytic murein transglycosylase A